MAGVGLPLIISDSISELRQWHLRAFGIFATTNQGSALMSDIQRRTILQWLGLAPLAIAAPAAALAARMTPQKYLALEGSRSRSIKPLCQYPFRHASKSTVHK